MATISKIVGDVSRLQAWWSGKDFRLVLEQNMDSMTLKSSKGDPEVKMTEDNFDGVQVFIFQKHGTRKNRPGLMYYHGGGFLFGHPVGYAGIIRIFVKNFDMVVVAPRYRKTAHVKAPIPHEDCKIATNYFFKNAEKFGVDPKMIGAAGDSAGGNLTAAMCLMMRDERRHQFLFQVLNYPWTQAIDNHSPSRQRNFPTTFRILSPGMMGCYLGSLCGIESKDWPDLNANKHVTEETWKKFESVMNIKDIPSEGIPENYKPVKPSNSEINTTLAEKIKEDLLNPYIFPLCAKDTSKLPPAFILTAESDPLQDDGIWYAKKLERSGVKVTHFDSPDGFHGMMNFFDQFITFDAADTAMNRILAFVRDFIKE